MKKIISFILAVITVVGCFTVAVAPASAATDEEIVPIDYKDVLTHAIGQHYASVQAKIKEEKEKGYLKLMASLDGYELWCNQYTGEVIYRNTVTDTALTTNPINYSNFASGDAGATELVKKLLSQVEINFIDNKGKSRTFYSFEEAANRNQITVKYMKNGFRVEYIMGRLDTNYLLPGVVLEDDYNRYIWNVLDAYLKEMQQKYPGTDAYEQAYQVWGTFRSWYKSSSYATEENKALRDKWAKEYPDIYLPSEDQLEDENLAELYKNDGHTQKGQGETIYYLDEAIKDTEKIRLENYIKTYCPDFTQETLDKMHSKTGYVAQNNELPVFRLAIEYVLEPDGKGLSVRLPASSIRFDETKYTLTSVEILQYFGAVKLDSTGYVFYPDGSGALIDFADFRTSESQTLDLSATVYGEDFAYYNIDTSSNHAETIRMPVFGVVDSNPNNTGKEQGYLAILEEGDALADIAVSFDTSMYYSATHAKFYPRPSDSYNMSEAISVADNKEMTIVSDKKYTGFYKIRYVMLFDNAQQSNLEAAECPYYHATYIGMANAYRDYLESNGYITALTENDIVPGELPVYIETFGSIETTQKILSIPVTVDVALTSFADVKTMYSRLSKNGVSNINFKLTGFANGGMNASYPKKVKWIKAVGGKDGFEDLITEANSLGYGVYPEFNFSYVLAESEGKIKLKDHAARAVDDRYCSKQVYNAIYQEFESFFDICVSPSSILEYVEKFEEKFSKFNPIGISVSTLGSDLNSDFNEENSLNREDAKDLMIETLGVVKEDYGSVMASGGNIYSVKFLDHILDVSIDASNYQDETRAVPFMGMVLHGYVNYAGSAINEAGDGDYQLLKSIENGAVLYYMLIYQNASLMKEDKNLNKYYSVRFDIWFDTILSQYKTLNDAIGDLQLYKITDHKTMTGNRVPSDKENVLRMSKFNAQLTEYLSTQYTALREAEIKRLRVEQIARDLLVQLASDATVADLVSKVEDVLGEAFKDGDPLKATVEAVFDNRGTAFESNNGKKVSVVVDADALIAGLEAITGVAATEEQKEIIEKFAEKNSDESGDFKVSFNAYTESLKMEVKRYTDNSGRIVMVTYSNGTENVRFILNYNTYDVTVKVDGNEVPVEGYGFVRVDK